MLTMMIGLMKNYISYLLLSVRITLFCSLAYLLSACGAKPALAIENVTVIDAVNGVRENQRVVVDGGRIVSVSAMSIELSAIETIDGTGQFLIPGLWDMHVHFLYDETLSEVMAPMFLRYGITSVRDTGGEIAPLVNLRARIQASGEPAPRIFISGPLLDGKFVVYDGALPAQPKLGTGVPDVESARRKVRELKAAGADFIKIYELIQPDVYAALVEEARVQGMPVASHVPLMMTAESAGPMADSMEHLRNLELACAKNWEELLTVRQARISAFGEGRGYELRRELHSLQRIPAIQAYDETRCDIVLDALADTIQVPTLRLNTVRMLVPDRRPDWADAITILPGEVQNRWLDQLDLLNSGLAEMDHTFAMWSLFLVSRIQERGVPIGAGTDTPIGWGLPGYSLHTELEMLVSAGLSETQALYAATIQPARFFGLEAEMGLIQAGMRADLVLLDANPLVDIVNTRRISGVVSKGQWLPGAKQND